MTYVNKSTLYKIVDAIVFSEMFIFFFTGGVRALLLHRFLDQNAL